MHISMYPSPSLCTNNGLQALPLKKNVLSVTVWVLFLSLIMITLLNCGNTLASQQKLVRTDQKCTQIVLSTLCGDVT